MGATLGWGSGRQLTSYTKGSNNITYTYDADGLRASKTVNGVKSTYLYSNGLLVYQKQYKANHTDIDMHFWYNANGHLAAVEYFNNINDTWVLAYALTNSMGDVIGLYYGNGNLVTTYEYDAWGNLVYMNDTSALGVGTLNPIRYRSYYYDSDTGFYYCQSRYYNPQVGRWVNADSITDGGASILGNNLFIYVANNPVNYSDCTGQWIIKDAIKWVVKNVQKPIVDFVEKTLTNVNLTASSSRNTSLNVGIWNFSNQNSIAVDTKGNVAIQSTVSVTADTSGSLSLTGSSSKTVTNAPSVQALEGVGYQVGGAASVPIPYTPINAVAGVELNIIPATEKQNYYGVTSHTGISIPTSVEGGSVYAGFGTTDTIYSFNVFETIDRAYIKIMEW